MFEIINKQIIGEDVKRLVVSAPHIAQKILPGQFVAVCAESGDEKIPLSVVDWDTSRGTISLIFKEVGDTTSKLGTLPINESISSILGPLGIPSKVEKAGKVVCIATEMGIGQMLPISRHLKNLGNKVVGIIGAKTKKKLILEAQMRLCCSKLYITTDDGSYERKGQVTTVLKELMNQGEIDFVYCIGAVGMMQEVSELTKTKKIKTFVQLKPIMVDCMGMCGSCRVRINGKIVRACTDGPEFNGHQVDFEDFKVRIKSIKDKDKWHKQGLMPKSQKKELKTFTRFLSDFLNG